MISLKVTELARAIKDKAGRFPIIRCNATWYAMAKMTIEDWNANDKWCSISEQLQALALAKGTEKSLQEAIRKAK